MVKSAFTPAPVSGAGIFLISARCIRRRTEEHHDNAESAASRPDSGAGYSFIRDTSPHYPISKRYMGNTPVSHETIITNSANKIKP